MLPQSQGLCNVLTNEEKEKMPNNVFKNSIAAVVRHRPARNWANYYCGEFVTVILLPPSFVWRIAKCVQANLLKVTEIGLFVTFFFVDIKKKNLNWVQ